MQPRSHESTKKTMSFLFRVFVSSWLLLLWIGLGGVGSGILGAPKPLRGEGGSRTFSAAQESSASNAYVGAQACASCHKQVHDTWTAGRHSKMIQPATSGTVKGDFSRSGATLHGRRYGFRVENGQYFVTESELTGKPQEHRVEYTLGSRRIQHYLTTLDKGRIVVLRAKLGRAAPGMVPQRRNHPAGRGRSADRAAVEQELRRLPCQPAGERVRPGDAVVSHRVDGLRDVVRAVSRTRAKRTWRTRRQRDGDASIVRPTRLDREHQHDGVRAVPFASHCHQPRLQSRRRLLRLFRAGARIRAVRAPARVAGSAVLGRRTAAPLLERRDRTMGERVLPARRRHLHDVPHERALARRRQEPAARLRRTARSEQRAVHDVSSVDRRASDRAHASSRRQHRQLLRRMPHAEDGDEHQVDDARSHDRRAGAGEHGALQHSERVHGMPQGQARLLGG